MSRLELHAQRFKIFSPPCVQLILKEFSSSVYANIQPDTCITYGDVGQRTERELTVVLCRCRRAAKIQPVFPSMEMCWCIRVQRRCTNVNRHLHVKDTMFPAANMRSYSVNEYSNNVITCADTRTCSELKKIGLEETCHAQLYTGTGDPIWVKCIMYSKTPNDDGIGMGVTVIGGSRDASAIVDDAHNLAKCLVAATIIN